jgi:hypothetical protein
MVPNGQKRKKKDEKERKQRELSEFRRVPAAFFIGFDLKASRVCDLSR